MRKMYFIDLFCGAGGVTSGIHRARHNSRQFAEVLGCVNHDPLAIASHESNHPDVLHYTEDIRTLDLSHLRAMVQMKRIQDPDAIICLWASLECTNFSKAKGGLPRDADSRTLAEHIFRYLKAMDPDYLWIENVEEFMSWGPLKIKTKKAWPDRTDLWVVTVNGELRYGWEPISQRNGEDYIRWVNQVQDHGYNFDYRILNAADYGAYTSRKRYFAQFAKPDLPISWPEQTHSKKPVPGMFGAQKPWKAVKDVLDFNDEGESIFTRKKPLSEKTLERIYAGLVKYVAGGKEAFIAKYYSGGGQLNSVDEPAATLPTKDRLSLVQPAFLVHTNYNNNPTPLEVPAPTVTANRKWSYLVNPSWYGNPSSIDRPAPVIVARQDKAPMYMVMAIQGKPEYKFVIGRSLIEVRIKQFMAAAGIVDIKMRMLKIPELLRIQGFGSSYKLAGTQADRKRFIGNAVEVNQARVLIEASYAAIMESKQLQTA